MSTSDIMQSIKGNRKLQAVMRWTHLSKRQFFDLSLIIFSIISLVIHTTISAQLIQCRTYYYIYGTITAGSNLLWGTFSFIQDGRKKILDEDIDEVKKANLPSLNELLRSLRLRRESLNHHKRDHDISAILVGMTLFAMIFAGINITFWEDDAKTIVNWRAWTCLALDFVCLLCDYYFFCVEKGPKVRMVPAAQDVEAQRQVGENQGGHPLGDIPRDGA